MKETCSIFSNKKSVLSLLLISLLFMGMALHHGWANYKQDEPLEYTGVVLSNDIGNPHTYIQLEVIEEDDLVWEVVLAPLSRMRNRGFSDNSMLAVGNTVTVVGYQHRTIENEMRAERIIIGDVTVELR
ncbi:DUF6152 family protein [soil metagenome]